MALQERSSVWDICTKDLHPPVRQAAEFQAIWSPGCKEGVETSPEEAMKMVHGSYKVRELGRFILENTQGRLDRTFQYIKVLQGKGEKTLDEGMKRENKLSTESE